MGGRLSALHECGSTDDGACEYGTETCDDAGAWVGCNAVGPGDEICNGIDDNCDGTTDDLDVIRFCQLWKIEISG